MTVRNLNEPVSKQQKEKAQAKNKERYEVIDQETRIGRVLDLKTFRDKKEIVEITGKDCKELVEACLVYSERCKGTILSKENYQKLCESMRPSDKLYHGVRMVMVTEEELEALPPFNKKAL